jgi:nitroreductase
MMVPSNAVLDCIFARKSVRHFTGSPASRDELELLMKAAMAAPTARNMQPWSFAGVLDPVILKNLAEGLPYAKMLPQAGSAVVVCGDMDKRSPGSNLELWVQDCSAATQNLLLAAESLGLGAVWTACYPYEARYRWVRKVLGLPAHIMPFSVVPVGHPSGEDVAKDKFRPENIHWDKW